MPIAFVLLLASFVTVAAADYPADPGSRPRPAADWPGLWGPSRSGALEHDGPISTATVERDAVYPPGAPAPGRAAIAGDVIYARSTEEVAAVRVVR